MRNVIHILGQENGSVMVVSMLMLVLLTIIGIAASNTSTTEVQISTNEQLSRIVFYAAESGIDVGRQFLNDLKLANAGNWDNLLSGNTFTWRDAGGSDVNVSTLDEVVDATWNRNAGLATYTLQVSDNDDLDGNPAVDTDNMVVLTSTATYRNSEAQVQATVRYQGPSDDYAQEHYNTGNTSEAANENAEIAGSQRW
jgi:Tfp pilus assembly protein PilX